MKEELKEWIKDIAIALVIAGLILVFFKPIVVKQESMQPTFYSDDYVIIKNNLLRHNVLKLGLHIFGYLLEQK